MHRKVARIFCILICCIFGCGGGTEGSGLRNYDGTVLSRQSEPVSGARLTIVETGESTLTSTEGKFSFMSIADGDVQFLVELGEKDAVFALDDIDHGHRQISMQVEFDLENEIATVRNLVIKAAIVEDCDYYFENRETIRQANHVPQGQECVLNVELLADGQHIDSVPIALQYRECGDEPPWQTLQVHSTGETGVHGEARFLFLFEESDSICEYRVVAPYEIPTSNRVTFEIESFAEQEREAAHPK